MNMLNLILPAEEAASLHKLNQLKDSYILRKCVKSLSTTLIASLKGWNC